MSEQKGSSTHVCTIYVRLLGEGTIVWRPTKGARLFGNVYEVLPTDQYDEHDEQWEFPPGSIVECEIELRGGNEVLIAKRKGELT